MKRFIKVLLACLTLTGIISIATNSNAEEVVYADDAVAKLFETYYADGVYVKDTSIFMNETAVNECINYFHAKSTILDRTTYYAGNELWMSRGDGTYSYYGSAENNGGVTYGVATTPLIAPDTTSVVLSGTGKESMENYYVTLFDFKEATYSNVWTESNGVYTTTDATVLDNFRQFTAPCILPDDGAGNYLIYTHATVEEVGTSLVMKLYLTSGDSGKLTTNDNLFSQATVTNDNKYVTSSEQVEILNIPYSTMYTEISSSETGWIDVDGVARYGIGHGASKESFEMFKSNNLGSTSTTRLTATQQFYSASANTDYMFSVIEAIEDCYAKFTIDEAKFSVYFWGNVYIYKCNTAGVWTQLSMKQGGSAEVLLPYLQCEYQELKAGEKLVLEVRNLAGGERNFANPSGVAVSADKISYRNIENISDVKTVLLDDDNSFEITERIRSMSKGNADAYMSIGLLADTEELPVAPGGKNGWSGFTADSDTSTMRVQFLANTAPDAFYYTYTAKRSGYVYVYNNMLTWNPDVTSSVIATLNGVEVYNSGERTHVGDGAVYDKVAVYLEAGETLRVQVNHLSNPSRSVFGLTSIKITFVPSATEYALPEGYETLIDYFNA